jgi:hypothetical protein
VTVPPKAARWVPHALPSARAVRAPPNAARWVNVALQRTQHQVRTSSLELTGNATSSRFMEQTRDDQPNYGTSTTKSRAGREYNPGGPNKCVACRRFLNLCAQSVLGLLSLRICTSIASGRVLSSGRGSFSTGPNFSAAVFYLGQSLRQAHSSPLRRLSCEGCQSVEPELSQSLEAHCIFCFG